LINILLADDHQIVREGLQAVLESTGKYLVKEEAENGSDVLKILENDKDFDVVVLDINMPEMDGITCAKNIKKDYPEIKVILLTMYSQKSFVDEILKLGIEGCLLKNNSGKQLKEAIERVSNGNLYYDHLKEFAGNQEDIIQFKLSEREIEVIKLLADGLTSQQIAEKLFVSDHTIRTHRKNILKKTNLLNTSQLIQFAAKNKII
jgi:DNA-binding NarL/FixJ family response regulator